MYSFHLVSVFVRTVAKSFSVTILTPTLGARHSSNKIHTCIFIWNGRSLNLIFSYKKYSVAQGNSVWLPQKNIVQPQWLTGQPSWRYPSSRQWTIVEGANTGISGQCMEGTDFLFCMTCQ